MYNLNKILTFTLTFLLIAQHIKCQDTETPFGINTPVRSLRLPNTTYPLSYTLHIGSNIHLQDFSYSGNVTIDIEIRESTNEIVMHAKNLSNFNIKVTNLADNEIMNDLTYSLDTTAHFLIIHPTVRYVAFEAGQQFRVEILFNSIMQEKSLGIYWLTYDDLNNQTVYLAATQFEPTSARLAFPCYDEPGFKSNFTIHITHTSNYMAISNMQVHHIEHHSNNLSTTIFATSPPISTYLVAFVISDFHYIAKMYRGVEQRIYTSPGSSDKGHNVLKNVVRTVAALEDYFGINYPLTKLDHIALKKNYGAAMENWGLITYKEDTIVGQTNVDMHKRIKDLLTQNHEIVHQWFGNLVSPKWWTYAWLNEGFATYFSYVITDLLYPEYKTMDFFLTDIAERAYSYGYIAVRPMTYYVEKESEISAIFDIITYQRAACVIKMFHHAFHQKIFVMAIQSYFHKYQYTSVDEDHLFETIQETITASVKHNRHKWSNSVVDIMRSWTNSEWIPILSVIRNYEDNSITLRQKPNHPHSDETWWIPINFATSRKPNFEHTSADYFMPPVKEVTLQADELGFELSRNDWLIVNKQQTGFYHVLYDDENLIAIAKKLQENHQDIHALNRAAIFQDLCPLIENNAIENVAVIFELLKYLKNEQDLMPWNLVADTILFLDKNLYGTPSANLYKQFVRQLVGPIFRSLFAAGQQTDNYTSTTEVLARQKLMEIACGANLQECLDYTRELAYDYIFRKMDMESDLDYYGMQDSILCLGVKYLRDEEFNRILEMLTRSRRDNRFYDDLIYSLRCTQSRAHLEQYLNVLLGENATHTIMNDKETMMYMFYLYKANMVARPVVWKFFENNYKLLCRSPSFLENFNRIAEYIPHRHRSDFLRLRQNIEIELQILGTVGNNTPLITADSPRIGKKMILSESFLHKFGNDIFDWLMRDQMPITYAASTLGARNAADSRLSLAHKWSTMLFRKLFRAFL